MIDKYSKAVLTVIAACLVVLTLDIVIPKVNADSYSSQNYGLVPVNKDGTINVKLAPNSVMEVSIEEINTSEQLNVNINEIGGGYVPYGGPIKITTD
jgi:hypothetical protein